MSIPAACVLRPPSSPIRGECFLGETPAMSANTITTNTSSMVRMCSRSLRHHSRLAQDCLSGGSTLLNTPAPPPGGALYREVLRRTYLGMVGLILESSKVWGQNMCDKLWRDNADETVLFYIKTANWRVIFWTNQLTKLI